VGEGLRAQVLRALGVLAPVLIFAMNSTPIDLGETDDRFAYEEDRAGFLLASARRFGDAVPLKRNVVLFSGAEFAEAILTGTNKEFAGPADFLRRDLDGVSDSPDLLRWMQARGAALRGLNKSAVRASSARFLALARTHLHAWDPSRPIDVVPAMEQLAAPIVPDYCFGRAGSELVKPLARLFHSLTPLVASPYSFPSWLPIPRHIRERRALRAMEEGVDEIIRSRRRSSPGSPPADLLGAMIDADTGPNPLPDEVLRNLLLATMLAGYGVPPLALSWIWYLLATEPDHQGRLSSEVREVAGSQPVDVEHAQRLPYTQAVVRESLRLYPPVWLIARKSVVDRQFDDYRLRPGEHVMLSAYVVHRDERFFPEPDAFRPERWLTGETAKLPRFAYFPFGGGPRICMGYTLAMTELTLITAELVRRFILAVPDPDRVRVDSRRMLVPDGLVGAVNGR
jgi:cytochrome P450